MKLTSNVKQYIKVTFLFIYTGIETMLATLLTIFVHQLCPAKDGTTHDCSIVENFTDLTEINFAAVVINFLTLGIFFGFYILEYYREHKCIKYLRINENLPNNNLKNEITTYPKIEAKLNKLNKHYRNYSFVIFIINIVNIAISCIIIYQFYGGYKSIVGLLSETFLILDKIYNSMIISYKSVKDLLPYSAYMKDYIIFNNINPKYKKYNYNVEIIEL
jgi:hypothetical protein